MFYRQCNTCNERWEIGTASTCKCPDETPKREWIGLTDEEKQEWIDAMPYDIEPRHCMILINVLEAKLKQMNT